MYAATSVRGEEMIRGLIEYFGETLQSKRKARWYETDKFSIALLLISMVGLFTAIFFALSAITSVVIIMMHKRFIRQPQPRQILWATGNWVVHLTAFFIFLAYVVF